MKTITKNIIPFFILMVTGAYTAYAQTPLPTPLPSSGGISVPQVIERITHTGSSGAGGIVPPFEITVEPPSPSPGETVTITAQTPTFDKNTADFFWTINGKARSDLSGSGKNSFTLTAGDVGSVLDIGVQASEIDGTTLRAAQTVYPSDVVFTWSADTYIPKWYKGKALPVADSALRIVAFPSVIIDGTAIPPERLIYTWSIDGKRVLNGVGAQVLTYPAPTNQYDTQMVILVIQDMEKRITKEARTGIPIREPKTVIYELLPLGGVEFRRGMSMLHSVSGNTLDLQTEPFFYNTSARKNLSYSWTVENKTSSSTPENPFLLTLNFQRGTEQNDIPVSVEVDDTDSFTPSSFMSLIVPLKP